MQNTNAHSGRGMVFDIQKFSIHDGPGIRTTVFLKGCSFHCLWCHNPESIEKETEISYISDRCLICGRCVEACPRGCHTIDKNGHRFRRDECTRCGACVGVCYAGALEMTGEIMTVDEVMEDVLKDVPFYETSGGGMTLSGGEPMIQYDFAAELLKAAKANCLHTCLETNGGAPFAHYLAILELVDLFLYDFKESEPERHKRFTGASLDRIVANLRELDKRGASTVLRCPIIPGVNDRNDHFRAIADLAESLDHVIEINLMPYHPLGRSKSARIGKNFGVENSGFPPDDTITAWIETVKSFSSVPVKKG